MCAIHILLKSKLTRIKIQAAEEMLFLLSTPFLQKDYLYHRHCPVPNCQYKPQKLANHLTSKHPNLTPAERAHFLKVAIRVPKGQETKQRFCPRLTRGQQTLEKLLHVPTPPMSEQEDDEEQEDPDAEGSTRGTPALTPTKTLPSSSSRTT